MEGSERKRLVDEHMSLVRALAAQIKKQLTPRAELDDLVAYGVTGLMEAAERFDPRHGVTFVTFSYHRIRGAIYDGVRQMAQLPRKEYARVQAAARANEYLQNLADREAGAAAGGQVGPPSAEDDLRSMYEALAGVATTFVTSLEGMSEGGRHVAADDLTAEELADVAKVSARVRRAIAELPDKERHFVEKHYFEDKTLQDAGRELGLSKSWASRLHARAVAMLRDKLAELGPD